MDPPAPKKYKQRHNVEELKQRLLQYEQLLLNQKKEYQQQLRKKDEKLLNQKTELREKDEKLQLFDRSILEFGLPPWRLWMAQARPHQFPTPTTMPRPR